MTTDPGRQGFFQDEFPLKIGCFQGQQVNLPESKLHENFFVVQSAPRCLVILLFAINAFMLILSMRRLFCGALGVRSLYKLGEN